MDEIPVWIGPPPEGYQAIATLSAAVTHVATDEVEGHARAALIKKAKKVEGCVAIYDYRIAVASYDNVYAFTVFAYGTAVTHNH